MRHKGVCLLILALTLICLASTDVKAALDFQIGSGSFVNANAEDVPGGLFPIENTHVGQNLISRALSFGRSGEESMLADGRAFGSGGGGSVSLRYNLSATTQDHLAGNGRLGLGRVDSGLAASVIVPEGEEVIILMNSHTNRGGGKAELFVDGAGIIIDRNSSIFSRNLSSLFRILGPGTWDFSAAARAVSLNNSGLSTANVSIRAFRRSEAAPISPGNTEPTPLYEGSGTSGGFDIIVDAVTAGTVNANLLMLPPADFESVIGQVQAASIEDIQVPTQALYHWDISVTSEINGPVTLIFGYAEEDLLDDVLEDSLDIFHFNGNMWKPLGGTIDADENTITVLTDTLSPFALGSVPEPSSLVALIAIGSMTMIRRRFMP